MILVWRKREILGWAIWTTRMGMATATLAGIAALTPAAAVAQDFTVDSPASDALTNYLRQNRLPLVGAQIGKASTGARRLVLYGYVATTLGKSDAESKATAYLGSPRPEVVNRIVIQPEIAKMRSGGTAQSPDTSQTGAIADYSSGTPGAAFPGESIDQVLTDIQRYGVKSPPEDSSGP
jgi:hypothetical protein